MPVTVTYPGVYIEELPSGVHTITGVATSIATFVGWAPNGPVDEATLVESWTDYQSQFGGFSQYNGTPNYLGYAVNQFFNNGGQQAYIIRLVADGNDGTVAAGTASVDLTDSSQNVFLTIQAANPGSWALNYGIVITPRTDVPSKFTLKVVYWPRSAKQAQVVEAYQNLSLSPSDPLYVVKVINADSNFVAFDSNYSPPYSTLPASIPSTPFMLADLTGSPPHSVSPPADLDGTVLQPNTAAFDNKMLDANGNGNHGVYLLRRVNIFNLLCVPGESPTSSAATLSTLESFCVERRAFLIIDCDQLDTHSTLLNGPNTSILGADATNAALYFPWVQAPDPLAGNRLDYFPPCGFVAGIYAKTDVARGVWKAPAGIDAGLTGAGGLKNILTDLENGDLNILGINCLRQFRTFGNVVWGARTLQGSDQAASEWKYVPIRRFALFLESSLYEGTQWVVFEPNDERLWGQIRLNVGAFMQGLFLEGAFQGTTPQKAYFVKCDAENNPQSSIDRGIVNILVGFAPLYPAEFVIIQIQQMAGQLQA